MALRATNKFFRAEMDATCQHVLVKRASDLNAREARHRIQLRSGAGTGPHKKMWMMCCGCDCMLHAKYFNNLPGETPVGNDAKCKPLCIACGSRPIPSKVRATDILKWNSAPHRKVRFSEHSELRVDRPRQRPYHYQDPSLGPGGVFFAGGSRWRGLDGIIWLRCAMCLDDDRFDGRPSSFCKKCDHSLVDGRHKWKCKSCYEVLDNDLFDHARDLLCRDSICLRCGTRDLPETAREHTQDEVFVCEYENDKPSGWMFGMGRIWVDNERTAWKRCETCYKPAEVKLIDAYGSCLKCKAEFEDNCAVPETWGNAFSPWRWCNACVVCGREGRVRRGVSLTHCGREACELARGKDLEEKCRCRSTSRTCKYCDEDYQDPSRKEPTELEGRWEEEDELQLEVDREPTEAEEEEL